MPSFQGTPDSKPRSESPGSDRPAPSALPVSPAPPDIQRPADSVTGYPTSLQGMPWIPPQALPHPNVMPPPPWPVRHPETGYNAFNQPLPLPPMSRFTPVAAAWPPGMSPHPAYSGYPTWWYPTLRSPPIKIPRDSGDTAQVTFQWNNADRMDPFAQGPHYGPVLEPILAKIVGAVIKLNPLLAPPPGTQDDYLRWNMLFQTSNCYRTTEPQRSWVKGRNEPATHPRLTHVWVISRTFPWMIQVRAHDPKLGVTCGEVLDTISAYLYCDVTKDEYENLVPRRKHQIRESYRFNRSTDPNAPGGRLGEGLKRLDWLDSSSRFGGLAVNDTFVKEHCGDVLPGTFELKCLATYPLTTEEVGKQQRRLENPPRHQSRSRPSSQHWPMNAGIPADLDDEKRAHLAHEHPNDLNSSPGPSSPPGTSTYFDSRRHPKSPSESHQRSHTTTNVSRSSHLLARLVSLEKEVHEINAATVVTTEHLEAETTRANAAEHRALYRLRIATENRERAEHESARLREELELCKLQLENAQKELLRTQDVNQGASQRNGDRSAQFSITNLRRELTRYTSRLNDWLTRDVQDRQAELRGVTARVDQLRDDLGRLGASAGPGWYPVPPYPASSFPQDDPQPGMDWPPSAHSPDARWGMSDPSPYGEYHPTGPSQYVDHIEELDERVIPSTPSSGSCSPPPVLGRRRMFVPPSPSHDSRSPTPTQESYRPPRQQPMRSESAPPAHAFETSLHAPPPPAPLRIARVHIPSYRHRHRAPSPPRNLDEPEITHPIISSQPIDDGWIPRADSCTSSIQLPPPHELRQPIPPNSSSVTSEVRDSRPSTRTASHNSRVHDPVAVQPPPMQTTREHRDATPHVLTPFNLLSVSSKRNQTAASLDVYDDNTATNTVVGSPDHSAVSQTQPLPAIIPLDDRDPLAAASEWREREEVDRRQRRARRIRRPGVIFDLEE